MMKYSLDPDKKNILITGASGFIGRHLSLALDEEYNVFNLDSNAGGSTPGNTISLDLTNHNSIRDWLGEFKENYNIDIIIHLASRLISARAPMDTSVFYDNIRMSEGVVEIARALNPAKIIHFSSIAVYPNQDGVYNESSQVKTSVNSECLYGLSKFCSENIIDFMLKSEDIRVSHLRLSQVYGEGARSDRIMSIMREELRRENTITVFGDGERISNFISVDKLVRVVIELFVKKDSPGIFNIGDRELSYLQLAEELIKQYGNSSSRIIKKPTGSRAKVRIDTGKLQHLMMSVREGEKV